ncbi:MAG: hypothetical protein HZR80_05010 [Candidatus Heimdallarchaeota archaeon]
MIKNRFKLIVGLVEETLTKNDFDPDEIREWYQFHLAKERMAGKKFSIAEYIQALIYSQLSAQRVWTKLEEKLPKIDEIFQQYKLSYVKKMSKDPLKIVESLENIKAGSRPLEKQMKVLSYNLIILEKIHTKIEKDYTIKSDMKVKLEKAEKYIEMISEYGSEYNLNQIGEALAGEFLKNIGIPAVKPDVHILRILGKERLGILSTAYNTSLKKAITEFHANVLSISNDITDVVYYDSLFWIFGASKKAEICTKTPNCHKCLLTKVCNYGTLI